jgi:predicted Rossmann-fold nucleotide-binding protein
MHGYIQGDPGSFLHDTVDSAIYEHFTALRYSEGPVPLLDTLAQRIHDHAMDIALKEVLDNEGSPLKVVGIMGGHAMQRDEPRFGEVAHMARQLAERGYTVATGGGPGAMEAGNLGAWMSRYSASELDEALAILATVASWKEPGWFDTALRVRERWSDGAPSIGIPTWFYGHEPTNLFAAWVAKYFENSVREDGLLAIALHGVIFAPGSAGTIQEVFQDATQNHYGTFGWASPMVFLDTRFWTETKPVHPLLSKLAEGKVYGELIACLDRVEDIVRFIVEHPPRRLR